MKRLLLVAVLLAVMAPLYAATQNIDLGVDLEFRGVSLFRDNAPDDHFAQAEIYLWASADLADNVMGKVALKYRNDFGEYGLALPFSEHNTTNGDIELWEGYIKLSRIWDYPVSMALGRWVPEMPNETGCEEHTMNRAPKIPVYGEGFIINNNGPVDGARFTLDFEPSWVDFLWYKLAENQINANDDFSVYAVYGSTKAIENQQIDAYIMWFDNQARTVTALNETGIFGARATGIVPPVAGLGYKAELAYSHANIPGPGNDPDGFGGYAGVDYTFENVAYAPAARLNFYYLEHNFTQPYGHVDQDDVGEVGYGRILDDNSNLSRTINGSAGGRGFYFVNVGATIKPAEKWSLDGDYYKYNNSWGNSHLGHEIDLRLSYQYSENVTAELIGAYFISPDNVSGHAAATLLGVPEDAYLLKGGIRVSF